MPQPLFDENADKKATNLGINSKQANWLKDNREAIAALNVLADENGLFSDAWRGFSGWDKPQIHNPSPS